MKDYNYMTMQLDDIYNFVRDVFDILSNKTVNDIISETGINYRTIYRFMAGESMNTEVLLYFIREAYNLLENREAIKAAVEKHYAGEQHKDYKDYKDYVDNILEHYSRDTLTTLVFEGYMEF